MNQMEELIKLSKDLLAKNKNLLEEIEKVERLTPDFWKIRVYQKRLYVLRKIMEKLDVKKREIVSDLEIMKNRRKTNNCV